MCSNEDSMNSHDEYIASSGWSVRLKDLPRVAVPPPNLDFSRGQPTMTVTHSTSIDYDSDQFGDPAFIQALITNGSVKLTHSMLDWKYANRRQAQLVLPFLYVGPLSAAKDENFVRETKFTFLMSVRSTASGPARTMDAIKISAPLGIESHNLDIDSATDMIHKLPAAIKAVNDHLEQQSSQSDRPAHGSSSPATIQGRVLVFCETGNERSTAFVVAYLMAVFGIDAVTAIQTVQSQRFSMCIDDSIKHALHTFDALLKAKRDVVRAHRTSHNDHQTDNAWQSCDQEPSRPKRTFENVLEDDTAIDTRTAEQLQDHEGRPREAPFLDREL